MGLPSIAERMVPGRTGFGGGADVRRCAEAPGLVASERQSMQGALGCCSIRGQPVTLAEPASASVIHTNGFPVTMSIWINLLDTSAESETSLSALRTVCRRHSGRFQ